MHNITKVILAVVFLLCIAFAVYFVVLKRGETQAALDVSTIIQLPSGDESQIDTSHLARGLVPPTNKWFSGIALQKVPKTIFSQPYTISVTDGSLAYSLPDINTSQGLISNMSSSLLTLDIQDATSYRVTHYDDMSVSVTYFNDKSALATATLVSGSPYIQLAAMAEATITISGPSSMKDSADILSSQINGMTYAAKVDDKSAVSGSGASVKVDMPDGGLISLYASPTNDPTYLSALSKFALNKIVGTEINYIEGPDYFATTMKLKTANNQPTLLGLLPHQINQNPALFEYETLYGQQRVMSGREFTYQVPSADISDAIDLSAISAEHRTLLVTTLRREINATKFTANDSYFSGKEVYRSAQLLELAKDLDQPEIAITIERKLLHELNDWFSISESKSGKFFYYDERVKSIVGSPASFGSNEINDHHFHYGYFIYAASILAKYNQAFLNDHRDMVDLLVADIANDSESDYLPVRRSFDTYAGHSWASGSAPFNDGNNQESVSEAMNAWIGIGLWARVTDSDELEQQARWMLSHESQSAKYYWFNVVEKSQVKNDLYKHTISPLNWGGKRDYATFFSAEPNALLGILLIPMSPSSRQHLNYDDDTIRRHVNEAVTDNFNVQFGDYLLMYSSLANKNGQLDLAKSLPAKYIDGANSRSYMLAWILNATR